jgi:hypothetical protein
MAVLESRREVRTRTAPEKATATPAGKRGLSLEILFGVALESLARNKTRTFLAVLGIIIGAGLGVLIGFGACWAGATYAQWPVVITAFGVALPCVFAMVIGLFFGLYPAVRAARLSPLTALRYD